MLTLSFIFYSSTLIHYAPSSIHFWDDEVLTSGDN